MEDERRAIVPIVAYSAPQVAELMGYDVHVIYDAIKGGRLRAFVPNGNRRGARVLGRWVLDWMERGAQGGPQEGA